VEDDKIAAWVDPTGSRRDTLSRIAGNDHFVRTFDDAVVGGDAPVGIINGPRCEARKGERRAQHERDQGDRPSARSLVHDVLLAIEPSRRSSSFGATTKDLAGTRLRVPATRLVDLDLEGFPLLDDRFLERNRHA
jgi:hypothetical protein